MGPDTKPERFVRGIRLESPFIREWEYELFLDMMDWMKIPPRLQIVGGFPAEGPGLIIPNHPSLLHPPIDYFVAGVTARRTITMMARDTVMDPYKKEDPAVLKRTGKKEPGFLTRALIAFFTNIGDPIAVDRSKIAPSTLRSSLTVLDQGKLLDIPFQDTRKPADDLLDVKDAVLLVALRRPTVPIFVVGISGAVEVKKSILIKLRSKLPPFFHSNEPINYRIADPLVPKELGFDDPTNPAHLADLRELVTCTMADLLPNELKRNWMAAQRAKAQANL